MAEPISIYVHWPWCKAKCPYCDFNSHAVRGHLPEDDYVAAVRKELAEWGRKLGEKRPVASVFFGGGTPSLMSPAAVDKILRACAEIGPFLEGVEITAESNPTSASKTLFKGLAEAGVNRVSVGVQGLRPEWLKFLGREHDVSQAMGTLEDALAVFGNVNADVIYGLPEQQLGEWTEQLERLAEMGLGHISAYQLTVEKNTKFYSDVARGLWQPVDGDAEAEFFEATQAVLETAGYENYEISNFAKPGKACLHNVLVWQGRDYIGVGAGGHGRVTLPGMGRMATAVIRQPEGYLGRMAGGNEAFSSYEVLDGALAVQEGLLMGLRLAEGVSPPALLKRFGKNAYEAAVDAVEQQRMVDAGLLMISGDRMALTREGWPRLNGVLKRILRREGTKVAIAYEN